MFSSQLIKVKGKKKILEAKYSLELDSRIKAYNKLIS